MEGRAPTGAGGRGCGPQGSKSTPLKVRHTLPLLSREVTAPGARRGPGEPGTEAKARSATPAAAAAPAAGLRGRGAAGSVPAAALGVCPAAAPPSQRAQLLQSGAGSSPRLRLPPQPTPAPLCARRRRATRTGSPRRRGAPGSLARLGNFSTRRGSGYQGSGCREVAPIAGLGHGATEARSRGRVGT